jgi:hypothetical protein
MKSTNKKETDDVKRDSVERWVKGNLCKVTEKTFILKYLGKIVWKLLLQDRLFFKITKYQGFGNNQVNLYEFFFPGT